MRALEQIEKEQMRMDLPDFRPGDTVKVHVKIKEGEKERIQVFEGTVIRKRQGASRASFTSISSDFTSFLMVVVVFPLPNVTLPVWQPAGSIGIKMSSRSALRSDLHLDVVKAN